MDQSRALDAAIHDLPTARALIASLQDQLTKSQREIAALRHQLDVLCQRLFGRKSDRVDPRQLQLALEQLANEPGPVTEPVEMDSGEAPVRGHTRRRPTGRRPLPAHLPRRRVEIDVADADKLRRRAPRRAPLFARPELQTGRRPALRLSERRPHAPGDAPAPPDPRTHAEALGRAIPQRTPYRAVMPSRNARRRTRLNARQLDALIEEAIVDAYGESEQRVGFLTMLEEHLAVPFETDILGVTVRVENVDLNDADEIVAVCRRGRQRQRIPLLNLPLPSPPPPGWEWIEAYRHWARGSL
jgi:uncharacterized coiled-coil protein SlyX